MMMAANKSLIGKKTTNSNPVDVCYKNVFSAIFLICVLILLYFVGRLHIPVLDIVDAEKKHPQNPSQKGSFARYLFGVEIVMRFNLSLTLTASAAAVSFRLFVMGQLYLRYRHQKNELKLKCNFPVMLFFIKLMRIFNL